MFVELIDRLRCTVPHASSWLVAAASRTVDRHVLEGTLGCPVCGAEYPVRDGAVWFGDTDVDAAASAPELDAPALERLAALLSVDDRGGLYILDGGWARAARPLGLACASARFATLGVAAEADVVVRGAGDHVPFGAGTVRGAVLARASRELAHAAAATLEVGGRLVAPSATPQPPGMELLARDAAQWVAARTTVDGVPVSLRRASRS